MYPPGPFLVLPTVADEKRRHPESLLTNDWCPVPPAKHGGRERRDRVALVLDRRTCRLLPIIERIDGDGGYQGPKATRAAGAATYAMALGRARIFWTAPVALVDENAGRWFRVSLESRRALLNIFSR